MGTGSERGDHRPAQVPSSEVPVPIFPADTAFLRQIPSHFAAVAEDLRQCQPELPLESVAAAARRSLELAVFLCLAQTRGVLLRPSPDAIDGSDTGQPQNEFLERIEERLGSGLLRVDEGGETRDENCDAVTVPYPSPPTSLPQGERGCPILDRVSLVVDSSYRVGTAHRNTVSLLGEVHQRLLSMRLHADPDGRLRARSTLEARKEQGIFYTPECVVQYIVRRAIADRREASVLDPACGCGAFLRAAYRHLLEGEAATPTRERRLAVAAMIHGIDSDADAVLAARRALWLEAMEGRTARIGEGESQEALPLTPNSSPARGEGSCGPDNFGRQLSDLFARNIRCGDVLVDPGFDESACGFDAVIGNPPYRRELNTKHLFDAIASTEFGRRYRAARMDLSYYFVHRGLELLGPGGRLSFILGAYWTSGRGAQKLIRALRDEAHVEEIVDLGRLAVFPKVAGRHVILTAAKEPGVHSTTIKTVPPDGGPEAEPYLSGRVPLVIFQKTAEQLFRRGGIDLEPPADGLLEKLGRGTRLSHLGEIRQGIAENPASITRKTNEQYGNCWRVGEGVFALNPKELADLDLSLWEAALVRPYHDLCDLGRYVLAASPSLRLIYATADTWPELDLFPGLRDHLARFRPILAARRETRLGTRPWWQLHWPREERLWQSAKLIALQMAARPSFVPAARPVYVPFSVNVFLPGPDVREHLNYFAAVLNSRPLWMWFRHHAKRRGVGMEINGHVLADAPVPRIDFRNPADRRRHDRLVELVEQRMAACRAAPGENSEKETAPIEASIDALVAELYGLDHTLQGDDWADFV